MRRNLESSTSRLAVQMEEAQQMRKQSWIPEQSPIGYLRHFSIS